MASLHPEEQQHDPTHRPEILMKTKRTKRKRKRTAPTNRRSCASRTKTKA
jgi:hypothetical protein